MGVQIMPRRLGALTGDLLGLSVAGPGIWLPPTWAKAQALGRASFKRWFQHNTGPRVALVNQVGDVAVANQTEADALVGKRIIGKITIGAAGLSLRDFGVRCPDGHNPTSTEYLIDWTSARHNTTIEHAEIDGNNKMWIGGINGVTTSTGVTIQYNNIHRVGSDAMRAHTNSLYQYNYLHDWRPWNVANDGEFDLDTCPHADGIQVLRSGNTIHRNWISVPYGNDNYGSSAIMASMAQETIVGLTVTENFLEGGGRTVHLYPVNLDVNNPGPLGYPRGVVYTGNLFGKHRTAGSPFTEVGVPNDNGDLITRSGNLYDDTREAVPLPPAVARPVELVFDGGFDDLLQAAINWPNKSAGAGTLDFSNNALEPTRNGGSSGRSCYTVNTVPGLRYAVSIDYTKTTCNAAINVGITDTGTGSSLTLESVTPPAGGTLQTPVLSASGTYVYVFEAELYQHFLWYVTGTGSDGNKITIDNVSCQLAA